MPLSKTKFNEKFKQDPYDVIRKLYMGCQNVDSIKQSDYEIYQNIELNLEGESNTSATIWVTLKDKVVIPYMAKLRESAAAREFLTAKKCPYPQNSLELIEVEIMSHFGKKTTTKKVKETKKELVRFRECCEAVLTDVFLFLTCRRLFGILQNSKMKAKPWDKMNRMKQMGAILATVLIKTKFFVENHKLIAGDGATIQKAYEEELKRKKSPYSKCKTAKAAMKKLYDTISSVQQEARKTSGEIQESNNNTQHMLGLDCTAKTDIEFYEDEFLPLIQDPVFQACFKIAVQDVQSTIPEHALAQIQGKGNIEDIKDTPMVIFPQLAQILSTIHHKLETEPEDDDKLEKETLEASQETFLVDEEGQVQADPQVDLE